MADMFRGNRIIVIDKNGIKHQKFFIPGLKIKFEGSNSLVVLHSPIPKFKKCRIFCRDNAQVIIESSCALVRKLQIYATGNNCICKIGKDFSLTNGCFLMLGCEENLKISIGNDCMFASDIMVRTSDVHSIYSKATGEILNKGRDVIIGNHVWLSQKVTILKGVNIVDNIVIGAGSIVTKDCLLSDTVYAGNPAKPIKSDIIWGREIPC